MEWLEKLNSKLTQKRTTQTRSWDEVGLHAVEGELCTHIAWDEVRRVYAYKKDCLTVDQIRLIFMGAEYCIEFTEDDTGFDKLCGLLNEKLQIYDDWHIRLVIAPAFETTFTTIYPVPAPRSHREIESIS